MDESTGIASTISPQARIDPVYRVSIIPSAKCKLERVTPSTSLQHTIHLMMARNYSQIPVMSSHRQLSGVVSWRSIGHRQAFGTPMNTAADAADKAHVVRSDSSLFDAIKTIYEHDYVIVQGGDSKYQGIVTASDLSKQFMELAQPFLLLCELESMLRELLDACFTKDDLQAISRHQLGEDGSSADLTFGSYVVLLSKTANWAKFNMPLDHSLFRSDLIEVTRVRNDVMHFRHRDVGKKDLSTLMNFRNLLKKMTKAQARMV